MLAVIVCHNDTLCIDKIVDIEIALMKNGTYQEPVLKD